MGRCTARSWQGEQSGNPAPRRAVGRASVATRNRQRCGSTKKDGSDPARMTAPVAILGNPPGKDETAGRALVRLLNPVRQLRGAPRRRMERRSFVEGVGCGGGI